MARSPCPLQCMAWRAAVTCSDVLCLDPLGVCCPVTSALGVCRLSPAVVLGPTLGWGVWQEVLAFPSSVP